MLPDKVQLNIRISSDLAARLDNLSVCFRKGGRNQVALEILELCIDIYERAEQAKFDVLRVPARDFEQRET